MVAFANVALTDTFDTWRTRTNQVLIKLDEVDTNAIGGFLKANNANITAVGAFAQANLVNIRAQSAHTKANNANITAVGAFAQANVAITAAANAHTTASASYDQANTATTTATNASGTAVAAFAQANTATTSAASGTITAQGAFAQVNLVNINAQSAHTQANLVNIRAQSAHTKANNANITAVGAFAQANAAYGKANTVEITAIGAFDKANTVDITTAPAAFNVANFAYTNATANAIVNGKSRATVTTGRIFAGRVGANLEFKTISITNVDAGSSIPVLSLSSTANTVTISMTVSGGSGGGSGCFLGNEYVLMADGTEKRLDSVRVGESVACHFNGSAPVLGIRHTSVKDNSMYRLNGDLITTSEHPFWSAATQEWLVCNMEEEFRHTRPLRTIDIGDSTVTWRMPPGLKVRQMRLGDKVLVGDKDVIITKIEKITLPETSPGLITLVTTSSMIIRNGWVVSGWSGVDFDKPIEFDIDRRLKILRNELECIG